MGNNLRTKSARVVFHYQDRSPQCVACTCKVSLTYSIRFRIYGPNTANFIELSRGQIIQKPKKQEFSSLFMTHRLNVMYSPVKFHEYIQYSLGVRARTRSGRTDGTDRGNT